jgi:hypothetical protein
VTRTQAASGARRTMKEAIATTAGGLIALRY